MNPWQASSSEESGHDSTVPGLDNVDPEFVLDSDDSVISPNATPPESTVDDFPDQYSSYSNAVSEASTTTKPSKNTMDDPPDEQDFLHSTNSGHLLVPWPGSVFNIRCVSSGRLLILLNGQIVLTKSDDYGSVNWECIETEGWLGFRNTACGRFLGHDKKGILYCFAEQHRGCEQFCVRMRPQGGCVMRMPHWWRLCPVGVKI